MIELNFDDMTHDPQDEGLDTDSTWIGHRVRVDGTELQ